MMQIGESGGGRRVLDSEVNVIPMVDLLICCISFLLITAVWSHLVRLPASAQSPGTGEEVTQPTRAMHVHVSGTEGRNFRVVWREGGAVLSTADVASVPVSAGTDSSQMVRYPDLAARVRQEWQEHGVHRNDNDLVMDRAVVHSDAAVPFEQLVGVIDAIYGPQRGMHGAEVPAFQVTFAAD